MLLSQNVTVVELESENNSYLEWLSLQDRLLISGVSHASIVGYNNVWWIFTYDLIDSISFKPTFLPHQKLFSDNVLNINPFFIGEDIKRIKCMYTYDWRYAHTFWNKMLDNNIANYKKIIFDNIDSWMNKILELSHNYENKISAMISNFEIFSDFDIYNNTAIIMSILNYSNWPSDWSYNTVRPGCKLASKWKTLLNKNDYIIDFRASHIYRLSDEINYKWDDYPYLIMAKQIFDKEQISEEEINAVKIEIFSTLYGNEFSNNEKTGIEFLDKAKEYKNKISLNCEFEKSINGENWWNMHINLLELKHVMNWIWERIDFFLSRQIKLKGYVYDSVIVNISTEEQYKKFMGEDLGSSQLKIKRRK